MVVSWQQIWTDKLDAVGASIDTGPDAFGEFPFLRIIIDVVMTGSNENGLDLRFNGDTSNTSYTIRRSLNGGSDETGGANNTYAWWYNGYGGTDLNRHAVIDIANEKLKEKLIHCNQIVYDGTFSSAPNRQQNWSKWCNTSDYITDVELSFNQFGAGATQKAGADTKMTIFGGSDGTAVMPSLPNGSVFITSDTNVHYMLNTSAGTWNEVA